MQLTATWIRRVSLLSLFTSAVFACGADASGVPPAQDDTVAELEGVLAIADSCVIATTFMNNAVPAIHYAKLVFDEQAGTLTSYRSSNLQFDEIEDHLMERETYTPQGRIVSRRRGRVLVRFDYDDAGNLAKETFEREGISGGVGVEVYDYELAYDDGGRLAAWRMPSVDGVAGEYESESTYTHDSQGRCATVFREQQFAGSDQGHDSTFEYDEEGRVSLVTASSRSPHADGPVTVRYEYDGQGRAVKKEQFGAFNLLSSPEPVWRRAYTYYPDGSSVVETVDRLSDVPTQSLVNEQGDTEWFTRDVQTRSAGCAPLLGKLQPALPLSCSWEHGMDFRLAGG